MKTKSIIILFSFFIFLASCDRPECKNTNPVFESNGLETTEYKLELVKEMDKIGKENLTYWFSKYVEQNGKEFISINIQGEGLCAEGMLQVDNWTNMEGIKKTKGKSYNGAQLEGLNFDIIRKGESIDFIYKNLESIMD